MITMLIAAGLINVIQGLIGLVFIFSGVRDLIRERHAEHRNNTIIFLSFIEMIGGAAILWLGSVLTIRIHDIWVTL